MIQNKTEDFSETNSEENELDDFTDVIRNMIHKDFPDCIVCKYEDFEYNSGHQFLITFKDFYFVWDYWLEIYGRGSDYPECMFSQKIPTFVFKHIDKFLMRYDNFGMIRLCINYPDLREILIYEGFGKI